MLIPDQTKLYVSNAIKDKMIKSMISTLYMIDVFSLMGVIFEEVGWFSSYDELTEWRIDSEVIIRKAITW